MILLVLIVSLTMPVDRGIGIFKFLMAMFGVLLVICMSGIIFYLSKTGFYPPEMIRHGG
jgi:hypothetical protein